MTPVSMYSIGIVACVLLIILNVIGIRKGPAPEGNIIAIMGCAYALVVCVVELIRYLN